MPDSLAVQPFDILHKYASGLYASECLSRVPSLTLPIVWGGMGWERRTFME